MSPSKIETDSREQRILDAASALISHYGYDKTTVEDIARAAGISKGAIYLHFLDLDDARVIFDALAHGEQGFSYKEYKGTPAQACPEQGRRNGNGAISRVLSITVKGENAYIELKAGPGKLTNTGAITPNGKPEVEVNVGFKLYEARRMAASVLAYLHAWDVIRMMCHHSVMADQQMVSRPAPYLLVPAASGVPRPDGAVRPPAGAAAGKGRSMVHDPVSKAKRVAAKRSNGRSTKPNTVAIQLLKYGDGSMVDGQNLTEVQTFQQYAAEKKAVPKSKAVLLNFYRQRF